MKKILVFALCVSTVSAGGLSYWGLDEIIDFQYQGRDTIKTPYLDWGDTAVTNISIIDVVPYQSFVNYSRSSSIFPVSETLLYFQEDTSSPSQTQILGPIFPAFGNNLPIITGIIIPDTINLTPGYEWMPGGLGNVFILDIDRDLLMDTVTIVDAYGRVIGIEEVQSPGGVYVQAWHILLEYEGIGEFGNGYTDLTHKAELHRWWTPKSLGQNLNFYGLVKEEFSFADSSPDFHILANHSTGRGTSLLWTIVVNIDEDLPERPYKDFDELIIAREGYVLDENYDIYDVTGKRCKLSGRGVYFLKAKSGVGLKKVILIE